jgi:hypothetical protein
MNAVPKAPPKGPLGLGRMMDEEQLERMMGGERAPPVAAPIVIPAPVVRVDVPQQQAPDVNVRVDTASVAAAITAGFEAALAGRPKEPTRWVLTHKHGAYGEIVSTEAVPHFD